MILFTDLDGTLLTDSKELTKENQDAIREAIEAGNWKDGLALALTAAEKENKPLLIGGSLFLAADARAELTGERYE